MWAWGVAVVAVMLGLTGQVTAKGLSLSFDFTDLDIGNLRNILENIANGTNDLFTQLGTLQAKLGVHTKLAKSFTHNRVPQIQKRLDNLDKETQNLRAQAKDAQHRVNELRALADEGESVSDANVDDVTALTSDIDDVVSTVNPDQQTDLDALTVSLSTLATTVIDTVLENKKVADSFALIALSTKIDDLLNYELTRSCQTYVLTLEPEISRTITWEGSGFFSSPENVAVSVIGFTAYPNRTAMHHDGSYDDANAGYVEGVVSTTRFAFRVDVVSTSQTTGEFILKKSDAPGAMKLKDVTVLIQPCLDNFAAAPS